MATEGSPGTALVTGGAGFIGSRLVAGLLGRGGAVRAVARTDSSADRLRDAGCEVVRVDLLDRAGLADAARGCDAVYHLAGDYRVGIRADERAAMEATNVTAAERVMDAAIDAGVARIVHVSTVNAFGDTGYRVVDEAYRRPQPYRYVNAYDETKHRAHLAAERRMADGAPILIAMPGAVYGPNDHSSLGGQLRLAADGRLRAVTFGDAGLNMAHVDDIAAGIELVGAHGRSGEPLRHARAGAHQLGDVPAGETGKGSGGAQQPGRCLHARRMPTRDDRHPSHELGQRRQLPADDVTGPPTRRPGASWATRRATSRPG